MRTVASPPESPVKTTTTVANAAIYVLSGCSQPLLMVLCRNAGLADPSAQFYMLAYYLGPALVIIPLLREGSQGWPSRGVILKGCGISIFDICAQSMNYTGASLAGPTIFAIVYSSVTVWTALFSQIFLGRSMIFHQWIAVVVVFGGLTLTATDSLQLGAGVVRGLTLVVLGSMMHALTYVMSEGIMTLGREKLTGPQNCAVQSIVASTFFLGWQFLYTLPRYEEVLWEPMQEAHTTVGKAIGILGVFGIANLIHALTFFHTLKYFPGGSTSAGVMKGLQAVLVFVASHVVYCGRTGGTEMCFTRGKFLSLCTVVGGVIGYGFATSTREKSGSKGEEHGYERISRNCDTDGNAIGV